MSDCVPMASVKTVFSPDSQYLVPDICHPFNTQNRLPGLLQCSGYSEKALEKRILKQHLGSPDLFQVSANLCKFILHIFQNILMCQDERWFKIFRSFFFLTKKILCQGSLRQMKNLKEDDSFHREEL